MATHSSILAWRIPWTEEPGGLQSMESARGAFQVTTAWNAGDPGFDLWVRKIPWRREWLPTLVFLGN